jgi:hypothetical protein
MRVGKTLVPWTHLMELALQRLVLGGTLDGIGRPTKQRLNKYHLARFCKARDWDGPMFPTAIGRKVVTGSPKYVRVVCEACHIFEQTGSVKMGTGWLGHTCGDEQDDSPIDVSKIPF